MNEKLEQSREVMEWLLVHGMSPVEEIPEGSKAGYLYNTTFQHINIEYIKNTIACFRTLKLAPRWEPLLKEAIDNNTKDIILTNKIIKDYKTLLEQKEITNDQS